MSALVLALPAIALTSTYGSRNSGSWGSSATWYLVRTGTITVTSGSTIVTGSGTLFSTELAAGDTLVLQVYPKLAIGGVSSISDNTSLTLAAPAGTDGTGGYGIFSSTYPLSVDNASINSGDSIWSGGYSCMNLTVSPGGILTIQSLSAFHLGGDFVLSGSLRGTGSLYLDGNPAHLSGVGKSYDAGFLRIANSASDTVLSGANLDLTTISFNVQNDASVTNKGTVAAGTIAGGNSSSAWINAAGSTLSATGTILTTGRLTANASNNTVIFNGGAQSPNGIVYYNLTLAGSGTKTISGDTVNGTLSMQGTASASAAPSYGTSATLEYKGSSAQTTGAEFPAILNKGVTINNANGVTLNAPKSLSGSLTFAAGNLFLNNNNLTLSGSVTGAGATKAIVCNGTGLVLRTIPGGGAFQFPVSTDGIDYNPVTIGLSPLDPAETFSVSIAQGVHPEAPNNQCTVQRKWTITEGTAGGNNATLTFQWDASQEGTSFTRGAAGIWRFSGSQWEESSAGALSGSGPYSLTSKALISTFSPFIVGNDGALPITLSTFSGALTASSSVKLEWSTISEVGNYGFEVERAPEDSGPFQKISPLIPGHGTTNVAQYYTFADTAPLGGINYYRLKQIDLDQATHFSETIAVQKVTAADQTPPNEFSLAQNYPNPCNPVTTIRFTVAVEGKATLKVYNAIGQEVAVLFNGPVGPGRYYTATLDGSTMASGVYFYRLESGARVDMKKFVLLK